MSKVLHYDCFAGISGDMNLAALIDLGVPLEYLLSELKKLKLDEYEIKAEKASKNGIFGTRIKVIEKHKHHGDHHHEHRSFTDIKKLIDDSTLSPRVKGCAESLFYSLASAEAIVHGKEFLDEVHFHEVGAVDSIIDIIGGVICLEYLNIEKITSSTVELGGGTVHCAHGVMPVPAPATSILARHFPSSIGGTDHEATTPTGAVIIAGTVSEYNPVLKGNLLASGIGVGHRDSEKLPNILRVFIYEIEEATAAEVPHEEESTHSELIANIDDMTPEHLSYLMEKLFAAGADDVWTEAIYMKKNRPAVKVSALVSSSRIEEVRTAFFAHSSSLGIREIPVKKHTIQRTIEERKTSLGTIRVKKAVFPDGTVREKPEFEDCRRIAEEKGIPLSEVMVILSHEGQKGKT